MNHPFVVELETPLLTFALLYFSPYISTKERSSGGGEQHHPKSQLDPSSSCYSQRSSRRLHSKYYPSDNWLAFVYIVY